jgi:hypothetical protein
MRKNGVHRYSDLHCRAWPKAAMDEILTQITMVVIQRSLSWKNGKIGRPAHNRLL